MGEKYAVVVGSMNCDMIFLQDRLPEKGETLLVKSASVAPGGKGANQAVQISKLGLKTYMLACTGKDLFGAYLIGELEKYGVDTSCLVEKDLTTGLAAVLTMSDGVYYSNVAPGSNFSMTVEDVEKQADLIRNASVAVFQCEITEEACDRAIMLAHEGGAYIVLNGAPARPLKKEVLACVDAFIVNENEATFYAGTKVNDVESAEKASGKIRPLEEGIVIMTLGAKGSLLCAPSQNVFFPADQTIIPVETTGSGDSYVGAFAYKKALGETDVEACKFASLVAQSTITKVGGQPSMPTLKEAEEFIALHS